MTLLVQPSDDPARIAHGQTVGRNVTDDHRACPYDSSVADGHARADRHVTAYPAALTDSHRAAHLPFVTVISIQRMFRRIDMHTWCNQCLPSDVYSTTVEDDASEVDEYALSGEYQVAVVAMERWFNENVGSRIRQQLTCDFRHCGLMIFGDVESPEKFLHLSPPRPHLRCVGIIGLTVLHSPQLILKRRTLLQFFFSCHYCILVSVKVIRICKRGRRRCLRNRMPRPLSSCHWRPRRPNRRVAYPSVGWSSLRGGRH